MRFKFLPFIVLLVLSGGCATARMKPPSGVSGATALPVSGHSGSVKTFREKPLQLGPYQVGSIDRDWDKKSSTSAGPWSRDAKKKAYRYDVTGQGRNLHGECTEQAIESSVAGFGKLSVTFSCVCSENGSTVAQVDLKDETGSAQVSGAEGYKVSTIHDSEQGARVSSPLGYHFTGPHGEGAVDVSGPGRAWLPAQAEPDESLALACQYAGLLLYRPTTW
jgi:hypothetical protein